MSEVILRRRRGEINATVRQGQSGRLIVTTKNVFIFPLLLMEVIAIALLMALNYCFRYSIVPIISINSKLIINRFDEDLRYQADMVNYENVLVTCDQIRLQNYLSRPKYDYSPYDSKSLEGLELNYELPEWAFFLCTLLVPLPLVS